MDLFEATRPVRDRPWIGYGAAIAAPLLALAVRYGVGDSLRDFPFLVFFPALLMATFFGGWKAGALAAAFSCGLAVYYLIDPVYSFALNKYSGTGVFFFAVVSAALIGLMQQVINFNQTLEARVAERTRELASANDHLRAEQATREAAEAQARQAQKMEAVGQLTGGIAHDFNNMLAIVIGSLELVKRRRSQGQDGIDRLIDTALDGAQRGAALTRRLLAFSRQQPLEPSVTNLNSLVQGMAELLRRTIGEMIELECALGGGLWWTLVDRSQLENAILNLAVNARDAMPDGGKLTIETLNGYLDDAYAASNAEVAPGQYAVVAVSDTGTGMPAEIIAKAFDPFFTTKGAGRGSGLGLSQVYGFVKQSGGHVKIYSEPGQGTTVKIYLRRYIADPARAEAERRPAKLTLPAGAPGEIILVVEDEEAVRRTTVESLRELGYTVRHARSAEEALDLLDEQAGITLLFTDVVMPGMTGRGLVDIAAQKYPGLKALYTTGYTPNAIVHNGLVDPGVDLLMKPFTLEDLARKVRAAIDRCRG